MPNHRALDEEALHRYLFREADRHQHLTVHQLDLARALMADKDTIGYTLQRMEIANRIRFISRGLHKRITYYITNPDGEGSVSKRKILWQ